MGKYGGPGLFMYATPTGCRVIEGENKSGTIDIRQYFTVAGVSDFFSKSTRDASSYEISNISGLVRTVVDELKNRGVKARKVFIVSNSFDITTEVISEPSKSGLKELLLSDLGSSKKKDGQEQQTTSKQTPGTMQSKTVWGDTILDGKSQRYSTLTIGEKFMLKSLRSEFYTHGYEVVGISDCVGQLMNLRQTEGATFDSPIKIILDVDTKITTVVLYRDIPVEITVNGLPSSDTAASLLSIVHSTMTNYGARARVYLTGDYFTDPSKYLTVWDMFEEAEITIFDIFDRPSLDEEKFAAAARGECPQPMTPDYSVCLAEMLAPYSGRVVNVVPPLDLEEIFKKNRVLVARGFLCVSVLAMVVSGSLAGWRFVQMMQAKMNPSNVSSMQAQVASLQASKTQLDETIQTLTQADVTILDIVAFVAANNSAEINIVSIDTTDMLTTEIAVEDTTGIANKAVETAQDVATEVEDVAEDVAEDVISGVAGEAGSSNREPIIIRGYARTGNAAVDYYDKLFKSGLPEDPVLNGVEKYTLPDGKEAYIFEIQIGGAS